MKNIHHNFKKQLLFISVFMTASILFAGIPAHAASTVLESGIPGVGLEGAQGYYLPDATSYINYLYIFVLSFVGIAGFVSLVIWGTVWVGSAVVDKKARAMEGIKSTLIGIGIALTAFIMLYTINPDLTTLREPVAPSLELSVISQCKTTGDCKESGYMCKLSDDGKVGRCVINPVSLLTKPAAGTPCDKKDQASCCAVETTSFGIPQKACSWASFSGDPFYCMEKTAYSYTCD